MEYNTIFQISLNSLIILFTHTLQTLVEMLRDASGRRWRTSQKNSAE